jgi:hypothetical protein
MYGAPLKPKAKSEYKRNNLVSFLFTLSLSSLFFVVAVSFFFRFSLTHSSFPPSLLSSPPPPLSFSSSQIVDPKQHVNFVEISCDSTNFQCLIDGVMFGPYVKVRISPVTDYKNEQSSSSSTTTTQKDNKDSKDNTNSTSSSSSSSSSSSKDKKGVTFDIQTFFPIAV